MPLPLLVQLLEANRHELTDDLLDNLAQNPRTVRLDSRSREGWRTAVLALYRRAAEWLAGRDEAMLMSIYGDDAHRQARRGDRLSDTVYALMLCRHNLRYAVQHGAIGDTPVVSDSLDDVEARLGEFFDQVIYHTIRGYEAVAEGTAPPPRTRGRQSQLA